MIFMAVNTPTKTEGEGRGQVRRSSGSLRARYIASYAKSDKIIIGKIDPTGSYC